MCSSYSLQNMGLSLSSFPSPPPFSSSTSFERGTSVLYRCSECGECVSSFERDFHRTFHLFSSDVPIDFIPLHSSRPGRNIGGWGVQFSFHHSERPRLELLMGNDMSIVSPVSTSGIMLALDLLNHLFEGFTDIESETTSETHTPPSVIEALPIVEYKEGGFDGSPICMICLESYYNKDLLRILPCMHSYHTGCIDTWLQRSVFCPICKSGVDGSQPP